MTKVVEHIIEKLELTRDRLIQNAKDAERQAKNLMEQADIDREAVRHCQDALNRIRRDPDGVGLECQAYADRRAGRGGKLAPDPNYISVAEASSMTGLSKRTIQSWCSVPPLNASVRQRGRAYVIKREDFLARVAQKGLLPEDVDQS